MALRRPPTRIELKADDVEEYDKVSCNVGIIPYDADGLSGRYEHILCLQSI